MTRQGYKVESGYRMRDQREAVESINPKFAADVTESVDEMEITDQEKSMLKDGIWQMYLQSLPELSQRKHNIHRKNRLGFSMDALRNYTNFSLHTAYQQARMESGIILENHLVDFQKEVKALEQNAKKYPFAARVAPFLWDQITHRHEAAMNPRPSAFANTMNSLGFVWYLGANVKSAFINLTQTFLLAVPEMIAKYGLIETNRHLGTSLRDLVTRPGLLSWIHDESDNPNSYMGVAGRHTGKRNMVVANQGRARRDEEPAAHRPLREDPGRGPGGTGRGRNQRHNETVQLPRYRDGECAGLPPGGADEPLGHVPCHVPG